MHFDFNLVPLIGIGCILALFARKLAYYSYQNSDLKGLKANKIPSKFRIWGFRLFGIFIILIALDIATSESTWYGNMMNKDSTRLLLLEEGKISNAKVTKFYFQKGAPKGWAISYEFTAKDPKTSDEKTWSGRSQGPRKYFVDADEVTVIYDPCEPRLNLEIRCFLNKPTFRDSFKKAGKLNLLDRFSDKYELEDYTSEQWYKQQQEKGQHF